MSDGSIGINSRLAAFVCDAVRFAASDADADARRLLRAPYSGVPRADAGALLAIAGARHDLTETIEQERVPLARDAQLAARRFLKALAALRDAYRAQGSLARELTATASFAFGLRENAGAVDLATLDALEGAAASVDAASLAAERAWNVRELCDAFEATVRAHVTDEARAADLADAAGVLQVASGSQAAQTRETGTFAPLGPYPREAARNVRRKRTHFSASSLGTYAACERRWYYRYACNAVEDTSSSASTYGTAFHWALERFHQEYRRGDAAPRDALLRSLETWIATAFERYRGGFDTNVEYELQRRRARRTGRFYLDWFVERSRKAPFTIVGTETKVELVLDGYDFMGYIDRVDRDDATGAVAIVDYKTGNIAESAAEYRAGVANFLDFQLPFYYWARTAEGDRVTRLALIPLKDAHREVRAVELEVVPVAAPPARGFNGPVTGTIGLDELTRARARMVEIARTLTDETIERFGTTDDPDDCRFCAYINSCRERPLQRESRFGR